MQKKRFSKLNEGFDCEHCGKQVLPTAHSSPRDHCPFCLWGRHVDINPGDRDNDCKGKLRPIGAICDPKKEYIIIYECERCLERKRSRAVVHDECQNDNFDLILKLSQNPIIDQKR